MFTPKYRAIDRILAQSGAFILYGLDPFKKIYFPYKIEETPFLVPQRAKEPIRKALANLGINESTLYPEIDKAAARIKNQYEKSVGHQLRTSLLTAQGRKFELRFCGEAGWFGFLYGAVTYLQLLGFPPFGLCRRYSASRTRSTWTGCIRVHLASPFNCFSLSWKY